ncbi:MAG: MOSC domain-containing protein [Cystobacter sp.]
MLVLSALSIYPLKSCAEIPLSHATVEPLGLQHDRRWMAVRPDGSFMTGREHPTFVHLRAVPMNGGLHLSAPDMPALRVPVPEADAPRLDITLWGDRCSAAWAGAEADRWLSTYLREPAQLVYVDGRMQRPVDPAYASPEDRVGFADGYPLLLASEASLADLNARLPQPVEMNRFRPNLVVSGGEPFAEDRWKRLRIGDVELAIVKPCSRCVFVNVDARTARLDAAREPLRTLATYRAQGKKVMFGQNVIARHGGLLRVGAPVEVLEEA